MVPVSWGFGLSSPGIFAFVFCYILLGTIIGSLVPNWLLGVIMCAPLGLVLVQTRRGRLGQGMLAMTSARDGSREIVALNARRLSPFTPSGDSRRVYPAGTKAELLVDDKKWWQGLKCRVGDDIYFVNPNYDGEVRQVLPENST